MRYELEPYHRNTTDAEYLADLRRVAKMLGKPSPTIEEYRRIGKYHPSSITHRCGGWAKALQQAGLPVQRFNGGVPVDDCLADLKRVAQELGRKALSATEYERVGKYSAGPLRRHFGSWTKALEHAELCPARTARFSNEEYFENLERMWESLGRQPHYAEVAKPFSRISSGAYEHRFGSWRKALEAFVAWVNQPESRDDHAQPGASNLENTLKAAPPSDIPVCGRKGLRTAPLRLRFLVLSRDGFRCCLCGRSPAIERSVVLHVDHIVPWSKGGPTVMENLRTLCEDCNLGRGNLEAGQS